MSESQLVLSYSGRNQNEMLRISQLDQLRLTQLSIDNESMNKKHKLDLDELEVRAEIHFTAPKNIINLPILQFTYQKKQADEVNCIIQFMLQGDYEDYQTYTVAIFNLLAENSQQLNQYNFLSNLSWDKNVLLYQNKLLWIFNDTQHTLEMTCPDLWFCKILGFEINKTYQFQVVNQVQKLQPDYKMYINLARKLNVTCPQLKYSTMYEQGQDRYILFKSVYGFQPGQSVEVVCNFTVVFSITQLICGFSVQFNDENFNQLILEDPYNILLYVNVSQKLIQRQQQIDVHQQQLSIEESQKRIEAINIVTECMKNKNQMTEQELLSKQNQIQQQMYLLFLNGSFNLEVEIQKVQDERYYDFVKQKKQAIEDLLKKFENLKFDFGNTANFSEMSTEQMQQFKIMYYQKQSEYLSEKNKLLDDCNKPLERLNQYQEQLHKRIINQQVQQMQRQQEDANALWEVENRIQTENKNGVTQQRLDRDEFANHEYKKQEDEYLNQQYTLLHQKDKDSLLKIRNDILKQPHDMKDEQMATIDLILKKDKQEFHRNNYNRILNEQRDQYYDFMQHEHELQEENMQGIMKAHEEQELTKQNLTKQIKQDKVKVKADEDIKNKYQKQNIVKPQIINQNNNQYYIDKAIIQQNNLKKVKRPQSQEKK